MANHLSFSLSFPPSQTCKCAHGAALCYFPLEVSPHSVSGAQPERPSGSIVTSLAKAPLSDYSVLLSDQLYVGVLVVLSVFHVRIMEVIVLLGTFSAVVFL